MAKIVVWDVWIVKQKNIWTSNNYIPDFKSAHVTI
jgi:hypothetical protein